MENGKYVLQIWALQLLASGAWSQSLKLFKHWFHIYETRRRVTHRCFEDIIISMAIKKAAKITFTECIY